MYLLAGVESTPNITNSGYFFIDEKHPARDVSWIVQQFLFKLVRGAVVYQTSSAYQRRCSEKSVHFHFKPDRIGQVTGRSSAVVRSVYIRLSQTSNDLLSSTQFHVEPLGRMSAIIDNAKTNHLQSWSVHYTLAVCLPHGHLNTPLFLGQGECCPKCHRMDSCHIVSYQVSLGRDSLYTEERLHRHLPSTFS